MNFDQRPGSFEVVDQPYCVDSRADKAHRRHAKAVARGKTRLGTRAGSGEESEIRSIGSQRIFETNVMTFARFLEVNHAGNLNRFPPDSIEAYLYVRSLRVGEEQLESDRWALQILTGRRLPHFKPARPQQLMPRAYTTEQIAAIASHQTPLYAFSTWLAAAAGLRSMELITIGPLDQQPADPRPAPPHLHAHSPAGVLYSVRGKGGLVRTVLIPLSFVEFLESRRRPTPVRVLHEGRHLTSYYDIPGGKPWAAAFSNACRRTFGDTAGAHGLRHTYAQGRMIALRGNGVSEEDALKAVSVEIGHFRLGVVKVYLRGWWKPRRPEYMKVPAHLAALAHSARRPEHPARGSRSLSQQRD